MRGSLIDGWPELADIASRNGSPRFIARLQGELLVVKDGGDFIEAVAHVDGPVGFVIAKGRVFKTTRVRDEAAGELFSDGDVLLPSIHFAGEGAPDRAKTEIVARGLVTTVALDDEWLKAVTKYPPLLKLLTERLAAQAERSSQQMAISRLKPVEDRILSLFGRDLIYRFGRVTADSYILELNLTHEHVARLVGTRRGTASKALMRLSKEGELVRHGDEWRMRRN